MMRRVLLAVALALAGCGSARIGEPLVGPKSLTEVEQRGRLVFAANCHECHPGGEGGLAPAINNRPLPGWLIRTQVRHGLGAMPSFGPERIPDQQLDELVAYVKAVQTTFR